jgi:hypothetical protein
MRNKVKCIPFLKRKYPLLRFLLPMKGVDIVDIEVDTYIENIDRTGQSTKERVCRERDRHTSQSPHPHDAETVRERERDVATRATKYYIMCKEYSTEDPPKHKRDFDILIGAHCPASVHCIVLYHW